jgi:hypothetical protein
MAYDTEPEVSCVVFETLAGPHLDIEHYLLVIKRDLVTATAAHSFFFITSTLGIHFGLHADSRVMQSYKETSHEAPTPEQELTDMCFEFDLRVKSRLALVPMSERQHLLHLGATIPVLRRPDRVS